MRSLATLLPALLLLTACSSHKPPQNVEPQGNPFGGGFKLDPAHNTTPLMGDFANNPATERFIDKMVREHGFQRQQLHDVLAQANNLNWVIRLMDRQAPISQGPTGPNGAWIRYRAKFITPSNVQNGVMFWNQYQDALQRAYQTYGVPPEIIVGIIGVETRWGRVMGKTRIIDALSTLAFNYPRRADFSSAELETFLLMAREESDDPLDLRGSYAGAMGYGQFMPSSFKSYAVDFNGDGHINLWDPVDAIGSVAHYFNAHGWVKNGPWPCRRPVPTPPGKRLQNPLYRRALAAGRASVQQLKLDGNQQVSLLRFDIGTRYQYWFGLPNFYAITRYNHSTHYAMAVWQLGLAVKDAR